MAEFVGKHESKRHGFKFDHVPTRRGSMYGGSVIVHYPDSYGAILDCVYEMADDISNGNGVSVESAIASVLRDQDWTVLPRHQRMIADKLK